jgi:hypothetical protein
MPPLSALVLPRESSHFAGDFDFQALKISRKMRRISEQKRQDLLSTPARHLAA